MANQDRTGNSYEQLLEASVQQLGYERNGTTGRCYLHPSKGQKLVVIPDTYIQPDIVIRSGKRVTSVLYVTHWSETRSSKKKFWRTWEEAAQQKLVVGSQMRTVNCIFEALPAGTRPRICVRATDLPRDRLRNGRPPLQLNGWDPGIGWAMIEAFDVSIIFPVGYEPVHAAKDFGESEHDPVTTELVRRALTKRVKRYHDSMWDLPWAGSGRWRWTVRRSLGLRQAGTVSGFCMSTCSTVFYRELPDLPWHLSGSS